jgi:predicted GNAT family N-acyltransferase
VWSFAPCARGFGLGQELINITLADCLKNLSRKYHKISAQEHLDKFYN